MFIPLSVSKNAIYFLKTLGQEEGKQIIIFSGEILLINHSFL